MASGPDARPETLALTPYAHSLGIRLERWEGDTPVLAVDFGEEVEGRPEHYHGGATSGLLETAAYAALRARLEDRDEAVQLKPINITVQFLAAAKAQTLYARARITKLGRRNANVAVEAWQDDPDRPRATAIMNILVA